MRAPQINSSPRNPPSPVTAPLRPLIDAAVPENLETATFALG